MKTLFLHVGQPKTGTSAIQVFLAQNHKQLKKFGIHYPGEHSNSFRKAANGEISSGNGVHLARYFRFSDDKKQLKAYKNFLLQLNKKKTKNILYSSEAFWNLSEDHFLAIRKICDTYRYTIKIIMFLRAQNEVLIASYAQAVKASSYVGNIYSYYEKSQKLLNYQRKLEILTTIFGKDNLLVYSYNKQELFFNFIRALGIDTDKINTFHISPTIVNPTPSVVEIEFLRSMNAMQCDRSFSDRLLYIRNSDLSSHEQKKLTLPQDLIQEIENKYQEMNQNIEREYNIKIISQTTAHKQTVHITEKISPFDEIIGKLVYSIHQEMSQNHREIRRLKKENLILKKMGISILVLLCFLAIALFLSLKFKL